MFKWEDEQNLSRVWSITYYPDVTLIQRERPLGCEELSVQLLPPFFVHFSGENIGMRDCRVDEERAYSRAHGQCRRNQDRSADLDGRLNVSSALTEKHKSNLLDLFISEPRA